MNHGNHWDAIHPRGLGHQCCLRWKPGRAAFVAHHCHLLCRVRRQPKWIWELMHDPARCMNTALSVSLSYAPSTMNSFSDKWHTCYPVSSSSDRTKPLDQVPHTKLQTLSGDVLCLEVICTLRNQMTWPKKLGVTMVFSDREVSTSFYRNPPLCGWNICFWKCISIWGMQKEHMSLEYKCSKAPVKMLFKS